MVLLLYGIFSCFTSVGRNNIEQRRRLAEACRPASEIIAGVAQTANLSANAKIIADLVWPGSNSTFHACAVPASQSPEKKLATRKLILRLVYIWVGEQKIAPEMLKIFLRGDSA